MNASAPPGARGASRSDFHLGRGRVLLRAASTRLTIRPSSLPRYSNTSRPSAVARRGKGGHALAEDFDRDAGASRGASVSRVRAALDQQFTLRAQCSCSGVPARRRSCRRCSGFAGCRGGSNEQRVATPILGKGRFVLAYCSSSAGRGGGFGRRPLRPATEVASAAAHCAAFLVDCAPAARSFSFAGLISSSWIVNLSSLPVNRNGGW